MMCLIGLSFAAKPNEPQTSCTHRSAPGQRRALPMFAETQRHFRAALLDAAQPVPAGVTSAAARQPVKRFALYRNNVVVSLVRALEARFPAVRAIVGPEFFAGAARLFVLNFPPR